MSDNTSPGLLARLQEDMKAALKGHDAVSLATLRLVIAAVRNAEIEKGGALDDAGIAQVLQRGIKTRRESVELYRKGNREDLAAREEAEIAVLQRYLPTMLPAGEVAAAVEQVIAELGAKGPADIGRVMKEVMARHRGTVDGKAVQALVASRLR